MYIARERLYIPNSWSLYLFHFWPSHLTFLFYTPTFINLAILLLCAITLVRDVKQKKYSSPFFLFAIVLVFNVLSLRYYWGERHDVYLYYLSPILFIFLGYMLVSLWENTYGKIVFFLIVPVLLWHMALADIQRTHNSRTAKIPQELQLLLITYPQNNLVFFTCRESDKDYARTLAYLLQFEKRAGLPEKCIGIFDSRCHYPNTQQLNFTKAKIASKFAQSVYPPISNTTLFDLSPATPSAIKKAGWKVVKTKDVFNDTINWWK